MKKFIAFVCGALLIGSAYRGDVPHASAQQLPISVHVCPAASYHPAGCNRRMITLTWGEQEVQPGLYVPTGSLYAAMMEITKPAAAPLFDVWMSLYRGRDLVGVYRMPIEQDGHPLVSHLLINVLEEYGYCSPQCPGIYSHIWNVAPHIVGGSYTLKISGSTDVRFTLRHIN